VYTSTGTQQVFHRNYLLLAASGVRRVRVPTQRVQKKKHFSLIAVNQFTLTVIHHISNVTLAEIRILIPRFLSFRHYRHAEIIMT